MHTPPWLIPRLGSTTHCPRMTPLPPLRGLPPRKASFRAWALTPQSLTSLRFPPLPGAHSFRTGLPRLPWRLHPLVPTRGLPTRMASSRPRPGLRALPLCGSARAPPPGPHAPRLRARPLVDGVSPTDTRTRSAPAALFSIGSPYALLGAAPRLRPVGECWSPDFPSQIPRPLRSPSSQQPRNPGPEPLPRPPARPPPWTSPLPPTWGPSPRLPHVTSRGTPLPRAPLRPRISLPRPPGPMPHRQRLPSLLATRPARS